MKKQTQSGMTLVELTVVLLILIALAGLVVPYMGGTSSKVLCDATDLTMQNIKKAIMNGYYLDTLGKFPQDLDGLTANSPPKYNLHYLFSKNSLDANPRIHKTFDPDSATGWRDGGYLQGGLLLNSANPVYKASSLNSSFTDALLGFVNDALADGHVIVLDGWGRPIILQVPTVSDCQNNIIPSSPPQEGYCARLVSAGSGVGLGINEAGIGTPLTSSRPATAYAANDRILYLNAPTPAADINPSCDQ